MTYSRAVKCLCARRNKRKAGKKSAAKSEEMRSQAGSPPKQPAKAAAAKQRGTSSGRSAVLYTSHSNTEVAQRLSDKKSVSVGNSNDAKAWAGPSYYTSPPPEDLPMPTPFLLSV